ncbi:MAG: M23 family metallopeptidase [Paludibacteraceae bacterium]|nr:M23 family metallopeptidase [Paludibacteraceae bacterium]
MKKIFSFIIGFFIFQCLTAQLEQWEISSPLDFETTLSGSFAEMRRNHFHGGIDLRTNGEENKPVYSIDDGYVAKISISRTGYGKCAYINHPNGFTSVYGHLNGFVPKLDSILKAKQYGEQKYEIDLILDSTQFRIKKGEQFALSGNTGASGGPHVHFEIRETETGIMRNPFRLKNNPCKLTDDKAPKIFAIKIYGLKGKGCINDEAEKKCKIIVDKDRTRKVQVGDGLYAWGELGFSVKANDYMTGTGFTYTPRHLRLYAENKLISDITIDSFLFKDTRGLNSFIDYKQWAATREFFMKSFKDTNSPVLFQKSQPNGTFKIDKEKEYKFRYEVEDDFGNKEHMDFTITGKKSEISKEEISKDQIIQCGESVLFDKGSFAMQFPQNAIYENVEHKFYCDTSEKFLSHIYSIGTSSDPLHVFCDISIKIEQDTIDDKTKYYIAKLNDLNVPSGSAGGTYVNGILVGKTNTFGRFAVTADVTPPVIAPVHTNKLRNIPYIRLKIYDTQSGIASYDAYIDNKWVMFEYDSKTQQITYWLDKKQVQEFKNHTFKLIVKDYCGNVKEYSKQIYW